MLPSVRRTAAVSLAVCCLLIASADARGQVRVQAEAIRGEPFGVGHVEIEIAEPLLPEALGTEGLGIRAKDNRVLYPAIERRPLIEAAKGLLGEAKRPAVKIIGEILDRPGRTNIFFLFVGDGPLEISIESRRVDRFTLTPRVDPAGYRRLLGAWWRFYNAEPGLLEKKPDYPPVVENYLRAMLARRLDIALPGRTKPQSWHEKLAHELGLAAGTESVRLAMERERFLGQTPGGAGVPAFAPADQPLPPPVAVPAPEPPEPAADVQVEPLALHVPAECLYVRFGNFPNFLWFQDTLARWGGDFQNLVATRGLDAGTRKRFETRLGVETTALARLFGETIVADVAIVGTDMFLKEGGAYGLLFQAKSSLVLQTNFHQQRQERLKLVAGATEQTVQIAGRTVSLLSSPDGTLRSYYAVDGDYHLITTSKTLARRFLETGAGKESLGATKEFRHARTVLPLSRNDSVFIYLSSEFFQNLTSPAYRVEMARRVEALADIELVHLALLVSATEGKPGDSIDQLVAGGFLPADFGPRADGSRAVLAAEGVRDSLRGERGAFIPIPDVEVTRASRAEVEAFREFAEFYRSNWEQIDPVMVGIQREPRPAGRERIVLDVRMTPLSRKHFDLARRYLGAPDAKHLAPIAADSVAFELVLAQQRLFGALQMIESGEPAPEARTPAGPLRRFALSVMPSPLATLRGYLGTDGDLGLLGLGLTLLGPRAKVGLFGPTGGPLAEPSVFSENFERFRVFSFHREVLQQVIPQLHYEQAERPAQIRLRAIDLSDSRITPFLNSWGYSRTRQTSVGNLKLLHAMGQQLHVPGDHAKAAAELLLDAKLVCPLGGQYVYRQTPEGAGYWTSTALEGAERKPDAEGTRPRSLFGGLLSNSAAPPGYQAPPLNWFRGLEADVAVQPNGLTAHAWIDMQLPAGK